MGFSRELSELLGHGVEQVGDRTSAAITAGKTVVENGAVGIDEDSKAGIMIGTMIMIHGSQGTRAVAPATVQLGSVRGRSSAICGPPRAIPGKCMRLHRHTRK